MKTRNFVVLILFSFSIYSCNQQPEKAFDAITIEKEVKEMFLAFDDSVRKDGFKKGLYFFDNSDAFYWVPSGYKYAIHFDSISTILNTYSSHFKYIDNTWDTLQIIALSKTYASFNGVINSYSITVDNDTTITKLSETGLVIKRGEHWKFLSGQTVVIENEQ